MSLLNGLSDAILHEIIDFGKRRHKFSMTKWFVFIQNNLIIQKLLQLNIRGADDPYKLKHGSLHLTSLG